MIYEILLCAEYYVGYNVSISSLIYSKAMRLREVKYLTQGHIHKSGRAV